MKKKHRRQSHRARDDFEPRLRAYSTLSTAALATAGAATLAGTATVVSAQTITGTFLLSNVQHGTGTAHLVTMPTGAGSTRIGATIDPGNSFPFGGFGAFAIHKAANQKYAFSISGSGDQFVSVAPGAKISTQAFTATHLPVFVKSGTHPVTGVLQPSAGHSATGYFGVKIPKGTTSKTFYYGWVRLKVTADGSGKPSTIQFMDKNSDGIVGAFGPAGGGITAGQTSAIPEPASAATGLALLALGAVGVEELRRRRGRDAA